MGTERWRPISELTPTEKQLAKRLARWRKRSGLSTRAAAKASGLTHNSYYAAETAARELSSSRYRRLVLFLAEQEVS